MQAHKGQEADARRISGRGRRGGASHDGGEFLYTQGDLGVAAYIFAKHRESLFLKLPHGSPKLLEMQCWDWNSRTAPRMIPPLPATFIVIMMMKKATEES